MLRETTQPAARPVVVDAEASRGLPTGTHCLVLSGGLAPPPLAKASDLSPLDLLVRVDATVLDLLKRAAGGVGVDAAHLHVLCSAEPSRSAGWAVSEASQGVRTIIDRASYRGPAGAIRDALDHLSGDGPVLIIEGSRALLCSLWHLAQKFVSGESDVLVGMNPDRTPAGVFLACRRALQTVPAAGFVDLKEQWLGKAAAAGLKISAAPVEAPGSLPVRTLAEAIAAARMANAGDDRGRHGERTLRRGLAGGGAQCSFSVVHPSARVHPSASVIDSVVMPNAVVEANAIVVRSIVCPGAAVQAGDDVVDSVARAAAGKW